MMQAGKDYGVRVVKPFQQFNSGFVMFPNAIYREQLLKGGWVEEVKAEDGDGKARQKILSLKR